MIALSCMAACQRDQSANGIYVEIHLKNDTDIDRYVVFNPNLKSLKACEESFARALPQVMATLPDAIPKNSTATGWKCSVEDPAKREPKK
jgi:hypothetical protein